MCKKSFNFDLLTFKVAIGGFQLSRQIEHRPSNKQGPQSRQTLKSEKEKQLCHDNICKSNAENKGNQI